MDTGDRGGIVRPRPVVGKAAVPDAVRRLMDKFDYPDRESPQQLVPVLPELAGAVGSGAFIHLSRGATQSIAVAGEPISWDTDVNRKSGFTAAVPQTAITIPLAGYYNVAIQAGWSSFTAGGSVWVVHTSGGIATTVWPPVDDPGLWTVTDGQLFEGTAPAVQCKGSDTIAVYIDADDASAQTLASATVAVYLVDRAVVSTDYRTLVLSHGPEAYWRLGEPAGTTAVDETGNGHDGTYVNTPTLGAAGLITNDPNTSVDFDGVNEYVDVAADYVGNGWAVLTLEAWVDQDANPGTNIIAGRDKVASDNPNPYAIACHPAGKWDFRLFTTVTGYDNILINSETGRHYLAMTYDGANLRGYLDGVEVSGSPVAMTGAVQTDVTLPFRIGTYSDSVDTFDGQIDEVAVYQAALSASQIAEHYRVGLGG